MVGVCRLFPGTVKIRQAKKQHHLNLTTYLTIYENYLLRYTAPSVWVQTKSVRFGVWLIYSEIELCIISIKMWRKFGLTDYMTLLSPCLTHLESIMFCPQSWHTFLYLIPTYITPLFLTLSAGSVHHIGGLQHSWLAQHIGSISIGHEHTQVVSQGWDQEEEGPSTTWGPDTHNGTH